MTISTEAQITYTEISGAIESIYKRIREHNAKTPDHEHIEFAGSLKNQWDDSTNLIVIASEHTLINHIMALLHEHKEMIPGIIAASTEILIKSRLEGGEGPDGGIIGFGPFGFGFRPN